MDKKLQTTITVVLAVLLVGGGIFFGITQAKKGAKCPFCGKYFPHGKSWGTNCAARKMIPILPLAVEQKPPAKAR